LKAEVVKAIRGESSFKTDLLNEMIEAAEAERDTAEQSVIAASEQLANSKRMTDSFKAQHDRLVSWAEIFGE
jgi:hypothetical protein